MFNLGDVLFQLFSFLIPVGVIFAIVSLLRSSRNRNHRIQELEKKVESLENRGNTQ